MTKEVPFEFVDRYINREQARWQYGELADRYARFYVEGDPVADAWARDLKALGQRGWEMFDRALERGIDTQPDAPASLRAFFASLDEVPAWVDFDALRTGARSFQRIGLIQFFVLHAWSMVNGYHSAPAVKPLAMTGQLKEYAARRLSETGAFVVEVLQEDGLQRFGAGFRATVRARLIHALIRQRVRHIEGWNHKAWGEPINQADMVGTIMEFSYLVFEGCRQMGFQFSPEETKAMLHLWRYAGHLSGVDPWLLSFFSDEAQCIQLAQLIHLIQPGPDQDSIDLTAALRSVPLELSHNTLEQRVTRYTSKYLDGLIRVFNGDKIADELGIPNVRWKHAIHPTRLAIGTLERIRQLVPGATWFAQRLGNRVIQRWSQRNLQRTKGANLTQTLRHPA